MRIENRGDRTWSGLCLAGLLVAGAAMAAEKVPPVPANPLLLDHSNFFKPIEIYELDRLEGCAERIAPLSYRAYSGVGFNLANTIFLVGPDGGIVVAKPSGPCAPPSSPYFHCGDNAPA